MRRDNYCPEPGGVMPHCETVTMTYRLSSVKRRQFYSIPVVLNDRVERSGGKNINVPTDVCARLLTILYTYMRRINNLWLRAHRAKLTYSSYCSRSSDLLGPDVSPDVNIANKREVYPWIAISFNCRGAHNTSAPSVCQATNANARGVKHRGERGVVRVYIIPVYLRVLCV